MMVRRSTPTGEEEVVGDQRAPLVSLKFGRRTYSVGNVGKGLTAMVATGVAMGAIIGTILHIIGWDFVSVRGQELHEVKREITKLHRNDTAQMRNQDSMLAVLRDIAEQSARQSRYQCRIMRRTDPDAIESDDPCQPVNGRR